MRHILITCICAISCLSLAAQSPQYGGPPRNATGQRPGQQGQRPQGDRRPGQNGARNLFAEIPDLTFAQHEQLVNVLVTEVNDLRPLMLQKRALLAEPGRRGDRSGNQPDARTAKKIAKIDARIKKVQDRSDKAVRKILSRRQYQVFNQHRDQYMEVFSRGGGRAPGQMRGGRSQDNRPRGGRPAGQGMPERRNYSGADSTND